MHYRENSFNPRALFYRPCIGSGLGLFLLCFSACATLPGWIFSLPPRSSEGGQSGQGGQVVSAPASVIQTGIWSRRLESRYSVMNRSRLIWRGEERIVISSGSPVRYEKTHLYAEYFEGLLLRRGYREIGRVRSRGPWVLLSPEKVFQLKETRQYPGKKKGNASAPDMGKQAREALPALLDPSRFKASSWRRGQAGSPLLYYYDSGPDGEYLIPLVFERFGKLYKHGLYEGSASPYDFTGPAFREGLRVFRYKQFHSHGYRRGKREKTDAARITSERERITSESERITSDRETK